MASLNTATKTVKTPVFTAEGGKAVNTAAYESLRRLLNACMLWEDNFYSDGKAVSDVMRELVREVPATRSLISPSRHAKSRSSVTLRFSSFTK